MLWRSISSNNLFFSRLSVISLLLGYLFLSPLIASATIFLPGETLEPDCAPGSVSCGVQPIGDAHSGTGSPTLPSPNTGALYLDTASGIFYAFNGTTWVSVGSGTSITSLNGQSGPTQTFVIGTSGTDFSIASSGDVHTFNIPDASASNRGLVTIGTQTFAGDKTFNGALSALGTVALGSVSTVTTIIGNAITIGNSTGGTALALTGGSTWSIASTGTASGLSIASGSNIITGLTDTNLSGTAGITNANLANSSLTVIAGSGLINGGSVALGGTTTLDIGAGSGISVNANDLAINLTTTGTTGATSNNSGLEVSSSGLALLKGCADNELLKWTDASGWACAADVSGGSPSLSTITSATTDNSISNGDNAQVWNWALTTASKTGFGFGENIASTNGVGNQYILTAETLAASTAAPLKIVARGNTVIDTTSAGGLILGNATAAQTISIDSGIATIDIGTSANDKNINLGDDTKASIFIGAGPNQISIGDNTASKTINIGGVDSNSTDTVSIASQGTSADTVVIGNANALTLTSIAGGTTWSISSNGAFATMGNISTSSTGTISSAGLLTAANGLTQSTGALNLTATSGALTLSGLSASSLSTGVNSLTITSSNFNTTATGINDTVIGSTTAAAGKFSTLTSTGVTDLANAGASNVTIATTGTGSVTIGNATGTFALASNGGLSVTTSGALTGVASLDTIATSATALTFAGAGTITSTTSSSLTLDSGTTGILNLGTGSNAKTINLGTGNAGNIISIGTSNSVSDTITLGSALDNIAINSDQWSVTDAGVLVVASCTGCGGGATLDSAYTTGNTVGTDSGNDIIFNLAEVATPTEVTINNLDTAGTNALQIDSGIASGTLTNGLLIEQSGAGTMSNGFHVLGTAGDITDGLHIEDGAGTIVDGLQFTGTFTNLINSTSLVVSNAGNITLAGTMAVNGDAITADGATLTINAGGTTNIQDALDVDSIIQAGSSNVILTLATGFIDADALTLTTAVDGGTGTSSGSGLIARTDGIGLLQGCTNGDILRWVEATDTWDCAALASSTETANDVGVLADLPNGVGSITEVMNGAEPSIIPETVSSRIWVTGSIRLGGDGSDDETSVFRVYRDTADDTSCDGTQVDDDIVQFTTLSNSDDFYINFNFIDSPATVGAVFYSICGYTSTNSTPNSVITATITIQEIPATGADLAELYATKDQSLEAGDIVSLDSSLDVGVQKSLGATAQDVIGIVSTAPAMVIGGIENGLVKAVPVALVGRVPVKVSVENGVINAGDYLIPSTIPGVAMKSIGSGTVIGQAMGSYSGAGIGLVLTFVKNFTQTNSTVLLGDISSDTAGLADFITTVQAEAVHNPVAIISAKINSGTQFLTDFVSARMTAIRGYFDELFATKIHTDQLCIYKADGTEVCVTGDQLEQAIGGSVQSSPAPIAESLFPPEPSSISPQTDQAATITEPISQPTIELLIDEDIVIEPVVESQVSEQSPELFPIIDSTIQSESISVSTFDAPTVVEPAPAPESLINS